jgi:hypothetical protein
MSPAPDQKKQKTMDDAKKKSAESKKNFLHVFPIVVAELVRALELENLPAEAKDWFKRVRPILDSITVTLILLLWKESRVQHSRWYVVRPSMWRD